MNLEIVKFPGQIYKFEVESGCTVSELIELASENNPDIDFVGEIRVNQAAVNVDTVLRENDRVIITSKIKGNQLTVVVRKFPGAKADLMLEHGSTVGQAIDAARATIGDVEGYDIRLNGNPAAMGDALPENGSIQNVILTKKVKGN